MMKRGVLLACFLLSFSVYGETIKIAMTDYEPIVKLDKKGAKGVFIEIINEAFKNAGISVVYESYPWKRAQEMAQENKVDAVIPLFKTQERELVFYFSDPVMTAKNKFFYIKNRKIPENFQWESLSDFKKFKVGGVIGYWYLEKFKKAGVNLELVNSDELNIQKMYNGRIDTFIADEAYGWNLINKNYSSEKNSFATLDKAESEIARYVLFGKKNPNAKNLMGKFNEGLKKLKASGEYDKILKNYEKTK